MSNDHPTYESTDPPTYQQNDPPPDKPEDYAEPEQPEQPDDGGYDGGGGDGWRDCRPRRPEDSCDPSSIDDLRCRASGIAAQAAYDAVHQPDLVTAQQDYDKARMAYRDARQAAALAMQDLKHQIKHLIERIRCLIEQERVVRCLDEAYDEVCGWLACCEGEGGCCAGDPSYDLVPPTSYDELLRRIDAYQRRVDAAKACFAELVGEPEALTKRVADAKAAIDAVNAALAEDPAKVDLKRVYAQALIARRLVGRVWNGFGDVTAYVDCLCRALTAWSKGVEATSVLTGAKAVVECNRAAAQAWCDALRGNPVEEILAEYERRCPSGKPCDPAPDEGYGDDDDKSNGKKDDDDCDDDPPEKPDCGCGHEHGKTGD